MVVNLALLVIGVSHQGQGTSEPSNHRDLLYVCHALLTCFVGRLSGEWGAWDQRLQVLCWDVQCSRRVRDGAAVENTSGLRFRLCARVCLAFRLPCVSCVQQAWAPHPQSSLLGKVGSRRGVRRDGLSGISGQLRLWAVVTGAMCMTRRNEQHPQSARGTRAQSDKSP